ncbi:MAG: class I poly(R)-hydroxyalkanoic acid synthase [Gammaproteobacteria bacterium]|nr:class I poly(R)-hydroxyalkanoic acid synthase [Gammaproteobacteria bacterium]
MMRQRKQGIADGDANSSVSGADFMTAARQLAALQQTFLGEVTAFWMGLSAVAYFPSTTKLNDKRFTDDAWSEDPRFDLIRRTYLAYSTFLMDTVDRAPLDDRTKGQMRFAMRQYVDAMSPANFLATNPEALRLAMESGGRSLSEGMALFFQDLAKGRISNNDEGAFEVGKNVATTEGAVIYENELIQLIQYSPRTADVHARPLVIIPPCINKYYILDLQPENSFVGYAVEQGHTVFLVSWRNITNEQAHSTWDDYLSAGVMRAIDIALAVTGADKVNALGFCIGGTLLASALAIMKVGGRDPVASLTLLTTMLDFFDTGEIGLLLTDHTMVTRELTIGNGGIMQGSELAFVFSALRANDLIWPYVVNSYLKGKTPTAFDMLYWNADSTNLPGPMFCWYVRNTYLENNLRVAGKAVQCGVPVDLSLIDCPTYIYASREDHIVPWRTAYANTKLLSGDKTFVLGASGHIAGVVNPPAKKKRNYWTNEQPSEQPEQWFEQTQSVPGSWWTHWCDWLAQRGGPRVPARTTLGNDEYLSIEPAPGRYVKSNCEE